MAFFSPGLLARYERHHGYTNGWNSRFCAWKYAQPHTWALGGWTFGKLEDAKKLVEDRVNEGSDYIKVVADIPGPDQATLDAVVKAAHEHNKPCVTHAASYTPYAMAQEAGADIIMHVPFDKALSSTDAKAMADAHRVVVLTLIMMKGIAENVKSTFSEFPTCFSIRHCSA
jgi:hypothetical protein